MKAFMVGEDLALLQQDGTWTCTNAKVGASLNIISDDLREEYGPEQGSFRVWLFKQVMEKVPASNPIDDEPEEPEEVDGPDIIPTIY
jgi:hypothetical protein